MKQINASSPKRVPKLRFPEFQDAPEWEEKKLINVADKEIKWSFIGGPFGSNLKSSDYTIDGVRIIQLQNIGDTIFLDDYKIYTSEEKADELFSCNIYPGEIILSKMGEPVARACFIPDHHPRYVMCSDGIRLAVNEKRYDKYFIYSFINSQVFRKRAQRASTGSTRKRIGLDTLKQLPLEIPSLTEQQRIADCLSSLDEWIAAEAKRLDALKDHKKGLMQQLFPAEGQTTPKLRFPEFQDATEWKKKRLSKILTIGNGRDYKYLSPGEIPVYGTGGFMLSVDDYLYDGESVCIGRKGTIDKPFYLAGRFWTVDTLFYTHSFRHCLPRFIYYLFLTINWRDYNEAGGVPSLSKTTIGKIEVYLPSLPEQQHIANCLSSLDDLITAQSNKLDALKDHKKGLMQQLFPKREEDNT